MKLKLLQVQLALFFEELEQRPDLLTYNIAQIPNSVFNQMPTILPIPPEAPSEVPLVLLNSVDGKYSCNIARSRIDFILNNATSVTDISVDLLNFINQIHLYVSAIFNNKRIIRFGLVNQYFYEEANAVKLIEEKYFNNSLGDLEELNIRYNRRFSQEKYDFNNVVDIMKGNIINENHVVKDGVLIQRDINNVPNGNVIDIDDMFILLKSKLQELDCNGIMEMLK